MFPIYSDEDFIEVDFSEIRRFRYGSLNLYDMNTDPLYDYFSCAMERLEWLGHADGYMWVGVHGDASGDLSSIIYVSKDSDVAVDIVEYNYRSLAEKIIQSGKWNGEPIVLLACQIGACPIWKNPAHKLSRDLKVPVYAPLEDVCFTASGFFYVSNEDIDSNQDPVLSYEEQVSKWVLFE